MKVIDWTITNTFSPGQIEGGSNGKDGVLYYQNLQNRSLAVKWGFV